jgi:hypothetical protein
VDTGGRNILLNKLSVGGQNNMPTMLIRSILGESVHIIKENAKALVVASNEIGLDINADKTKYLVMSQDQNAG